VVPRPAGLPADLTWSAESPASVDGLLIAHEWLDTVPCPVVEVDSAGTPRFVHVDPATGVESLGAAVADGPPDIADWLARWWPLDDADPGSRAEVGLPRDRAWAAAVEHLDRGVALAIDYGHVRAARPPGGSLRSFRRGRQVPVVPDGSRDVTAHVAVDAVAEAVGGQVVSQREALHRLAVVATTPPPEWAWARPRDYLQALGRASSDAELVDPGSFGAFWWVVSGSGCVVTSL
jgi:SAM-dependent MidA family methyltransferase